MEKNMRFNDYQAKIKQTAIYPNRRPATAKDLLNEKTKKEWLDGLKYLLLGLNEEAGEAAGKLKKFERDNTSTEKLKEDLKKELGDALWYITDIATVLGLTLEQVAQGNLDKTSSRKERGVISGSGDNR